MGGVDQPDAIAGREVVAQEGQDEHHRVEEVDKGGVRARDFIFRERMAQLLRKVQASRASQDRAVQGRVGHADREGEGKTEEEVQLAPPRRPEGAIAAEGRGVLPAQGQHPGTGAGEGGQEEDSICVLMQVAQARKERQKLIDKWTKEEEQALSREQSRKYQALLSRLEERRRDK